MCKSKYRSIVGRFLLRFIMFSIWFAGSAFAQIEHPPFEGLQIEDPISEGPREVPVRPKAREHVSNRAQESHPAVIEKQLTPVKPRRIHIGYGVSAFSFPFPLRRGPHVSYSITPQIELGAQYMKDRLNLRLGGVRFGGAEESFWLMQGRWFPWKHFNMSFGLGQRKVRFNFLSKQLATFIRQKSASHHIDIDNLVADFGFSHRWVNKSGLTFQADWLAITIPISSSRVSGAPIDAIVDERLRKGTKRAASILGRTPSVAFLGASAGWTF